MESHDSPIYSPRSPDYSPHSTGNFHDFKVTSGNQRRVYGEKINSLDRLICGPIGERKVLIEQMTFRTLNDDDDNDDDDDDSKNDQDEDGGVVGGVVCSTTGGDHESNIPSAAVSTTSGDDYNAAATGCGGTEIISGYDNKITGVIIIPSSTARVYSSFAINRRSIPKLCLTCFRSYCVCGRKGIDNVTRDFYDSRNYNFFGNNDE